MACSTILDNINGILPENDSPILLASVPAGFPSPADDYIESTINLNDYLISDKASTFYVRVEGDSMEGAGIFDGDILIVDRSLPASEGSIIIAVIEGEFTVKQMLKTEEGYLLRAANAQYPDLRVLPEQNFEIWGVVKFSIHKCHHGK